MSLIGLDSAAVNAAHETVQGKGGFFWLSYTTRNEVEVLSKGVGGVSEMGEAAKEYYDEEAGKPPLFGMINHRRRKILVKIVLEDTSRLIKARCQVHWSSVTTRFPDHDSTCEIVSPNEFTETTLMANTDLHSSRSSNGSGKKGALDEIREGAEEQSPVAEKQAPTADELGLNKPLPAIQMPTVVEPAEQTAPTSPPKSEPEVDIRSLNAQQYPPRRSSRADFSELDIPDEVAGAERRMSSQSVRPSGLDLFTPLDFSFLDKPKVKLGPRPLTDKRTSTARTSTDTRPTASLPAGLRAARPASTSRPSTSRPSSARPPSRDSVLSVASTQRFTTARFPPPPPIPESTTLQIPRPRSSAGSVKSLPATLPKNSGMSKEKQRLMKFREMYKQKEKQAKGKQPASVMSAVSENGAPEDTTTTDRPIESSAQESEEPDGIIAATETSTIAEEAAPTAASVEPVIETPYVKEISVSSPKMSKTPLDIHQITKDEALAVAEQEEHEPLAEKNELSGSIGPQETKSNEEEIPEEIAHQDPLPEEPKTTASVEESTPTPTTKGPVLGTETTSPTSVMESAGQISARPTSVSDLSDRVVSTNSLGHSHKLSASTQHSTMSDEGDIQIQLDDDPTPRAATTHTTPTALSPKLEESVTEVVERPLRHIPITVPGVAGLGLHTDEATLAALEGSPNYSLEPPPPIPDAHASSQSSSGADYDDDLVDELQSAVVEQAQPVSVSKSPVSAFFPRVRKEGSGDHPGYRAFSAPQKKFDSPGSDISATPTFAGVRLRSVSGNSSTPTKSSIESVPVAAKRVGGGIAARMEALQRSFSRNTPSPPAPVAAKPVSRGKSVVQRATDFQPTAMSPTPSARKRLSNLILPNKSNAPAKSEVTRERTPSPVRSPTANLDVQRQSVITTNSAQSNGSMAVHGMASPKSESISVRTTIIRPERSPVPPHMISLPTAPELRPNTSMSPSMMSPPFTSPTHQRARSAATHPGPFHPNARSSSVTSFQSLSTSPRMDGPGSPRSNDSGTWKSLGNRLRRLSDSKPKSPGIHLARSMSNSSLDTTISESSKTDKKASRTSRLLKRMSSSISNMTVGQHTQLQTLSEKGGYQAEQRQEATRPPGIAVGDVNVQFPDTLLWKLRFLEIDDQGFLVLRPSSGTEGINGVIKRFHLSEFQPPFPPDLDRQELPHSIVLDFRDGRTLQCACQSTIAQRQTLHMLSEYHMAWLS
ncbi:hypothetical protein BT63DRAFT_459526 [Microthyrium microscopicum]|uniref:ADF-H domain-containing protein n=1 Tax=Microthyrium microscopicum TaxID=703497 RepID=A0A6A6TXU8_9PEZI|nr:hypothetical protein BT63DRAFT_459526 [Microthyrium microscopicum]